MPKRINGKCVENQQKKSLYSVLLLLVEDGPRESMLFISICSFFLLSNPQLRFDADRFHFHKGECKKFVNVVFSFSISPCSRHELACVRK